MKNLLTIEDFMKVKKALEKVNVPMATNFPPQMISGMTASMVIIDDYTPFADCKAPATPCSKAECKQKGNNPMYVDNDKHIESSKINYLSDRASRARFTAYDNINETFNLNLPKAPKTPEALVDAITSGSYTILPKEERSRYGALFDAIVWRAPTVKADEAGAEAAKKVFDVLYKSAQDAIMISTPAEALTAVQALDAWTPTVTPTAAS